MTWQLQEFAGQSVFLQVFGKLEETYANMGGGHTVTRAQDRTKDPGAVMWQGFPFVSPYI